MSSVPSTESRGAWLWRRMSSIFGARFLDMWQAVDPVDMQAEWSAALRGMSREELQRGISRLYHTSHPPTLPEFLVLCRDNPAMYRQVHLPITDEANRTQSAEARTQSAEARAQLAKVRELAQVIVREHPQRNGAVQWAHRLLQRAADGEHVSLHQIACAKDAIEAWDVAHGRFDRDPRPRNAGSGRSNRASQACRRRHCPSWSCHRGTAGREFFRVDPRVGHACPPASKGPQTSDVRMQACTRVGHCEKTRA